MAASAHVVLVVVLAPLSYLLYRYTDQRNCPWPASWVLWSVVGVSPRRYDRPDAGIGASPALAGRGARPRCDWWYAAIAALLGSCIMQFSQSLWTPTAALTFDLVDRLLAPILPTLTADPATLVLGTKIFAVQIADVCSGLEGVGLMLAFSGAWLFYFRREYIFPRALVLIPAGIVAIFFPQCIEELLAAHSGSETAQAFPEVAIYGFHSTGRLDGVHRRGMRLGPAERELQCVVESHAAHSGVSPAMHNPTAAYLMPLLAILAAGTAARAISSGFEFFYPLRLIAGLWMLLRYRSKLSAIDWRWSWRGPAVGALVFLGWLLAAHFLLPESAMPEKLGTVPAALRGFWIASRIAGSVLIVPIAEELAYRGYLMRRLTQSDFESVPFESVRWPALTVTAIVFGLAHGALWLPGIAAGLAYGLILMRRGRIGEAAAAHATTNAH